MSEWKFTLAQPSHAEAFASWAAQNGHIDQADLIAGTKTANPTVLVFAVEKDGVAIAFAPVYLSATLAHLGFNPDAEGRDKLRAMQMLTDGVSAMMVQYGIREIITLSKPEYPVAAWAVKHDFVFEPRQLLKLDLNKLMASTVGEGN
jgi:hypothetical protein